jgi:hypothetical protein
VVLRNKFEINPIDRDRMLVLSEMSDISFRLLKKPEEITSTPRSDESAKRHFRLHFELRETVFEPSGEDVLSVFQPFDKSLAEAFRKILEADRKRLGIRRLELGDIGNARTATVLSAAISLLHQRLVFLHILLPDGTTIVIRHQIPHCFETHDHYKTSILLIWMNEKSSFLPPERIRDIN